MASRTGAIRAGRAFVEFFAEDSKLIRGLRRIQLRLKSFGAILNRVGLGLTALGTTALVPLLSAAKKFAAAGDQIHKMQQRTGFAAEALSALGFASEQSGASIDQLDRSLAAMARFSLQVERGLSTATDVLDLLGVSVNQFNAAKPEERFLLLAEAISKVSDPTKRAGLALQIFGRSGRELLPLLADGRKGIEALMQEAKALGITLSDEDAKAAAELTDAMNRLKRSFQAIFVQVGGALAPVLTDLSKRIMPVITGAIDWVKANRQLVVTVAKVSAAIVASGGLLIGLGTLVSLTGSVVGVFATLVSAINPVTLGIAALTGGAVVFFTKTEAGNKILDALAAKLKTLKPLLSAVQDAFNAGDFQLLGEIFQQTFDVALAAIHLKAVETWNSVKNVALDAWDVVVSGLAKALTIAFAGIQKAWAVVIEAMKGHWDRFVFGIAGSPIFERLFPNFAPDRQGAAAERQRRFGEIDQRTAGMLAGLDDNLANQINSRQRQADQQEQRLSENLQRKLAELRESMDEANRLPLQGVGGAAGGVGGNQVAMAALESASRMQFEMARAAEVGTAQFAELLGRAFTGRTDSVEKRQEQHLQKIAALEEEQIAHLGKIERKLNLPEVGTV